MCCVQCPPPQYVPANPPLALVPAPAIQLCLTCAHRTALSGGKHAWVTNLAPGSSHLRNERALRSSARFVGCATMSPWLVSVVGKSSLPSAQTRQPESDWIELSRMLLVVCACVKQHMIIRLQ